MNWVSDRPALHEECILITASRNKDGVYDYSVWEIKWINFGNGPYLAWLTGDGKEYGDLNDLTADMYLILQEPV